ncbi:MAG: 16S rRNA (guanine(966)-N(2))-methyltransferase RsmD [Bacilli bacterium]|nr:16S rRNA (guanine(966)-N(2))-methyltransferase RsmD [Bacilli bacterium]
MIGGASIRIISGSLKGREIIGYNIDGTRPTQDRVKESLFGSIQNYIKDSVVLDLFSGSGNLGFEAISNGANSIYLVDKSREAIDIINKNKNNFKLDNVYIYNKDYNQALDYFIENKIKFDIVFLDPPYKLNVYEEVMNKLIINSLVNDNALIICEHDGIIKDIEIPNLSLIKEKKYGSKFINIYMYEVN